MTTKPTTSTKPFRVTGAGIYRMRNGQSVRVKAWPRRKHPDCYPDFAWEGANDDAGCWRSDGAFLPHGVKSPYDLVRLDKPRPAKAARRGKAQWCVVVRCKSKRAAEDTAKAIGFSDDEVKAVVQRRTL